VERLVLILFAALAFLATASLIQGVSVPTLCYALIAYGGFASALLLAHAAIVVDRAYSLFRLLMMLGLVGGIGLLCDYAFPILDFLPRRAGEGLDDAVASDSLRRATFLFSASTNIYPFLALSVVAAAALLVYSRRRLDRGASAITIGVVPAGIAVTGSRAQLGLIAILSVAMFAGALLYLRRRRAFVATALVILLGGGCFVVLHSASMTGQNLLLGERYSNVFDTKAEGNYGRYERWRQGFELLCSVPGLRTAFGVGLGQSMAQVDGSAKISHYESSFFQAFAEGGILGLVVRYLPAFLAIRALIQTRMRNSYLAYGLLVWMVLYIVASGVSPGASAYHTQLAYFAAVTLAFEVHTVQSALRMHGAIGRVLGKRLITDSKAAAHKG
jgi:hypothetical protein